MQQSKLDYIVDKINSHNNLKTRMFINRKRALTLRIFIILSGSVVTVILGIPNFGDAKIIALILSAFITVLSSLDSLNNYHTKSLQQAEIVRQLETLLFNRVLQNKQSFRGK
jgi:hypothetical protein